MLKIGKDVVFYRLLEQQARVANRAAKEFYSLVQDFGNMAQHTKAMEDIEHEGDELTHELQSRVASTFITPLDKEDLRDLSQALDDITDYIEAAAARAALYKLDKARPDLEPLARLLVEATAVTIQAMEELEKGIRKGDVKELLKQIHTLENESDDFFRAALGRLFEDSNVDPIYVMKWKEMYDRIETAVDKCEDIAKILGTVIVKYG